MEFDQLQAVVALAATGNFSRAAEQVFRTQPALSMRIAVLERELGVALFEREARTTKPTEAGIAVLEYARLVLREEESLRRQIAGLTSLECGRLRIACSENISRHYLAPVAEQFLRSYPGVELIVRNLPSPAAEASVVSGDVDLAFTLLPLDHAELTFQVVLRYRDVGICADSHGFTKRRRVSPERLIKERLLLLNPETKTHRLLAADFLRHGLQPKAALELGSADTQKEFARIGMGIAVVPGYTVHGDEPGLHHFAIEGLALRMIAAVYRKATRSHALERFLEFL